MSVVHKVAVINQSTLVTDDQVKAVMASQQIQITRDFAPIWGQGAEYVFYSKTQKPAPGMWWLTVLDTADVAGDLGYHDLTDEGLPAGKVFVAADIQFKQPWSSTFSHEAMEMLVDPYVCWSAMVNDAAGNVEQYALEVCDAVEDESLNYVIDGQQMSDFVFPEYFNGMIKPNSGIRLDYTNKVTAPFQILPGGYSSVYTSKSGWQQVWGQQLAGKEYKLSLPQGSRRERRRIGRGRWMVSVPTYPSAEGN